MILTIQQRTILAVVLFCLLTASSSTNNCVTAFVVAAPIAPCSVPSSSSVVLKASGLGFEHALLLQQQNGVVASSSSSFPSFTTAASTLDPTTFLSDVFGAVLGTPLILAIPIVAALGVATLIAYLIVAYASPAEEQDD
jgi:hypothetical protein